MSSPENLGSKCAGSIVYGATVLLGALSVVIKTWSVVARRRALRSAPAAG